MRERIGAFTKRNQRIVSWVLGGVGAVVVLYYLVIAPGRSPDPMLTPLGSRIEYLITTPAFIAYVVALYVWALWLVIFTVPRKEMAAGLSTILTGAAIWLWTLDVARPLTLVLLVLGLAHGAVGIARALHGDFSQRQT